MAVYVNVSGNPIYVERGRVLLTDLETTKKNEWMRRRKLRVQQAREQAKDFLQHLRKKVSSESVSLNNKKRQKHDADLNKQKHEQKSSLKEKLEEGFSTIGSGHYLASLQEECDNLLREKQELRDEIAWARGAIAEERQKAEKCLKKEMLASSSDRKKVVRKVENLRSALIMNIPPSKSSTAGKKTCVRIQVHQDVGKDDYLECVKGEASNTNKGMKKNLSNTLPASQDTLSRRNEGTVSECEDIDSDDETDVTWPPKSARVMKEPIPSPRVKFYDHSTRLTKECPKPPYTVLSADPGSQPDMSEAIAGEEQASVLKENRDVLARRGTLIRGNKALRRVREEKETEMILKEIDELEKTRKIKLAVSQSYPSKFHAREDPVKLSEGVEEGTPVIHRSSFSEADGDDESEAAVVHKEAILEVKDLPPSNINHGRNVTLRGLPSLTQTGGLISSNTADRTEEVLESLIDKLKKERALKKEKETCKPVHNFSKWENILDKTCEEERRKSFEKKVESIPCRVSDEPRACMELDPNMGRRFIEKWTPITENAKIISPKKSEIQMEHALKGDNSIEQSLSHKLSAAQKLFSNTCKCSEEKECMSDGDSTLIKPPRDCDEVSLKPMNVNNFGNGNKDAFEEESESPTKTSSSQDTDNSRTLRSSMTYEGVKVVVKVSDKKSKIKSPTKIFQDKDVQTSLRNSPKSISWNSNKMNEFNSSSTSYRSLPSKISPENHNVFQNILTQLDIPSKNPNLHSYILNLLGMSRRNVENLPVSSVSEISVCSSLIESCDHNTVLEQINSNFDVTCQAEDSVNDAYQEQVLKFTDLAKGYADRVHDLAGMLENVKLLPCQKGHEPEDTSFLTLPEDIQLSVKLSNSVQKSRYLFPLDVTESSTTTEPHPAGVFQEDGTHSSQRNDFQRRMADAKKFPDLSTINEIDSTKAGVAGDSVIFDPNVSSIKGTPEKKKCERELDNVDSAGSSLCLLDERDIGSSLLGSSSDDFEEVFRSLGIGWALPTVRKVRESRRIMTSSSSSGGGFGQYSHSTPLSRSPVKNSIRLSPARHSVRTNPHTNRPSPSNRFKDSDSLTTPSLTLIIPNLSHSPNKKYS